MSDDAPSAKAEQKHRSHAAILDSADRLLRERGIAGASVADVMQGAGLTIGGFYAHFASKGALIDAALRRTAIAMRTRLFARLEEKPAADRAEVVVKRYLSATHRDTPRDGCPFPAVVGDIATDAPEHRDTLREQIEAFVTELEPHLPARPASGSGPGRRQIALGVIALMYGGISLARALRGTELSDDVLRACRALARLAVRSDARPDSRTD